MARRTLFSLIAAVAAAMLIGPSFFAPVSAAAPEQSRPAGEEKVWTNDDIELLHGITPTFSPRMRGTEQPGKAGQKYVRFKDPKWYREQLDPLRLELVRINGKLRRLRTVLNSAKGGTNSIDFDQDTEGITPESEVWLLLQHRRDILSRIDALEDLAQHNEIPPGELRKDRSPDELAMDAYKEDAANMPLESGEPQTEAGWREQFAGLRERLYYAQKELDVLQRELQGKLVQYYPDPNQTLRESFTRKEINSTRRKIAEKKTEIAALKQSLSDLEDDLRHAGGPPGWSRE